MGTPVASIIDAVGTGVGNVGTPVPGIVVVGVGV